MKNRSKTIILFVAAVVIATLASTGAVMAQECQGDCSVYTKFGNIKISSQPLGADPDNPDPWPIVVEDNSGPYSCGSDPNNYPCLAWAYHCVEGNCEKITKVSILIPNCCDRPISILYTSKGPPTDEMIKTCDESQSSFQNACSGYELRLTDISGNNPPPEGIFWFTTPAGIGTNIIDFTFPIQGKDTTCLTGITGPGCNTPAPKVRVDPVTQCYQFYAENQPTDCPNSPYSTWVAKWDAGDPCAVTVWMKYGLDSNDEPWSCQNVIDTTTPLTPEELGDIKIDVGGGVYKDLKEYKINNSLCHVGWLQFVDSSGCNVRCYTSGGRRYCR